MIITKTDTMMRKYNIHFIQKLLLFLAIIALPFTANASKLKLYKDVKVETLRVWLDTDDLADQQLANEIQEVFKYTIAEFNKKEATYSVVIDSTNTNNRVIFTMGPINYVNTGRSLSTTALDLGLIAGHVLLIANYGFTVPVWPFFMPKTNSLVEVDLDSETFRTASQMELMVGKNGYFMGVEKQKLNFKKKFKKVILKQLNSINKQNIRNSKYIIEK